MIYDFEGGADGNTANVGNTGAILVAAGSGNTIVLDDDAGVISGSLSLLYTVNATTNSCWCEFAGLASADKLGIYMGLTLPADGFTPSSSFITIYSSDDTTAVLRISVSDTNALQISDMSGAHTYTAIADVSAYLGTKIAIRASVVSGTTTTNGTVKLRLYANPLAAIGSYTGAEFVSTGSLNFNTGANFGKQRVGINTPQTGLPAGGRKLWLDYFQIETWTTGTELWVSGPVATSPPTAVVTSANLNKYGEAGTTFQLVGTGTVGSGGGTITGYTWTPISRPAGSATPTIATPNAATSNVTGLVPGRYEFDFTVTQSGGSLSSAPVRVTFWVHPTSGVSVLPFSVTKETGITREGTAVSDVLALGDTDASTLLQWPTDPNGQLVTIVWNPAGPEGITATFDQGMVVGTTGIDAIIKHYLEDGTTVLDDNGGPGYIIHLSGSITPQNAGLSPAAMTALGTALATRRALVTKIWHDVV